MGEAGGLMLETSRAAAAPRLLATTRRREESAPKYKQEERETEWLRRVHLHLKKSQRGPWCPKTPDDSIL